MRIQEINNQNNVSHKAYFKPNVEFKKLWGTRPQETEKYFDKLHQVKFLLPCHELEIIEAGRSLIDEKMKDFYVIFNNVTKKSFGVSIAVTSVKNHLVEVFDSLLEKNEKTRDFFNSTNDAVEFSKITNKFF